MSDLPTGWREAKLDDLGDWSSGGTPSRKKPEYFGGDIPWVKTGDLHHQLIDEIEETITDNALKNSSAKIFPRGSLLVAMYGATIGQTGVLTCDAATNQACAALLAKGHTAEAIPYVWRYLISKQNDLKSIGQGGAQPNISQTILKEFAIDIPPLSEQRRIVVKIDSLSSKSKRAREQLDHVPRLVDRYRQAVLAAAFRGDLTQQWGSKGPRLEVSVGRLQKLREERDQLRAEKGIKAKGKNRSVPSKIAELGRLPRDWTWVTFDDCSWDMTVGHVGPMKDRYVDKGIAFLRSLNVRPNHIETSKITYIDESFDRELPKSRLIAGDLVVVRTGAPGVAAVIPSDLGPANCADLVICRLVGSIDPHFAAFYMNSEYAKSLVRDFQVGVAQQHFNVGAMSEMPVPLPSLLEQKEIVRRIEHALNWIDRLAAEATNARKLVDHLDQAILAKAFRGELVPQDPNDEPASVLLDRIRDERVVEKRGKPETRRSKPARSRSG